MRSEAELLEVVYERANEMRRTRRRRWVAGASTLTALAVAAGVFVTAPDLGQSRVQLAGRAEPQDPAEGDPPAGSKAVAIGIIRIPKLDLNLAFVDGLSNLGAGPGRYLETPLPGRSGNSAIAGHQTPDGPGFRRLDELRPGDEVIITNSDGVLKFQVRETLIVELDSVEFLKPTYWSSRWGEAAPATLTLTTEHATSSGIATLVVGATLIAD